MSDIELERRVPCPDEMCIGVINEHHRCGTCGREVEPLDGDAPTPAADEEGQADAAAPGEERHAPPHLVEAPAADSEERLPCPDDMCIGIIGDDGRCGVCGR